jgi:hypothetical protein
LSRPTSYPTDLFGPLKKGFNHIYQRNSFYRQTGIVLAGLVSEAGIQYTLFDDPADRRWPGYTALSMNCLQVWKTHNPSRHKPSHELQAQHEEKRRCTEKTTDLFKGETKAEAGIAYATYEGLKKIA